MQVCEGFNHGLIAAMNGYWSFLDFTQIVASTYAPTGGTGSGYAMRFWLGSDTATTYTFANTEEWLHFAFIFENTTNTDVTGVEFLRLGAINAAVRINAPNGQITLRLGDLNGTVLASSAVNAFAPTVWNWIWIRLLSQNAGGAFEVYLNGNPTPIATFAGDTQATASSGWDQLRWRRTSSSPSYQITNVISYTAAEKTAEFGGTFPELFVATVIPKADFLNTFGGGGGWAQVDEIPWSTADNAIANAAGQSLLVSSTGLTWTPASVHGVAITLYGSRDGAVSGMQGRLEPGAYTGSTVSFAGAGVYTERQWMVQLNPNTGTSWNYAAVVAADFGAVTV